MLSFKKQPPEHSEYEASMDMLVSVCQLNINWRHLRRENLSWENVSIRLTYRQAVKYLLIDDWYSKVQPTVGSVIPGEVVQGCRRKQTEKALGSY